MAVAQFLQYAGPIQGPVAADPATFGTIAALPGVAYTEIGSRMLAGPVSVDGRPVSPAQVSTLALVDRPQQMRAIIIAGRWAVQSRADEAVLNESAAQQLDAHVGSVLELRGYRPSQLQQVLNGSTMPPQVVLGGPAGAVRRDEHGGRQPIEFGADLGDQALQRPAVLEHRRRAVPRVADELPGGRALAHREHVGGVVHERRDDAVDGLQRDGEPRLGVVADRGDRDRLGAACGVAHDVSVREEPRGRSERKIV